MNDKIYLLFQPWWWKFLLSKPLTWTKFWCRLGNHKDGPILYNFDGGLEPDMHCINCDDYLG